MNYKEQEDWMKIEKGQLYVSKSYFHHHAQKVLKSYDEISSNLRDCFNDTIPVKTMVRKRTKAKTKTKTTEFYKGINADDLNVQLRELIKTKSTSEIKFEVVEDKGVFYFSSGKGAIGGFDFAIINHHKNITALRNLCFGEVHYDDGQGKWDTFLGRNPELTNIAEKIKKSSQQGVNIEYNYSDESIHLIVGEIQFGNWALAYRDFFKVLKANVQNSIDCLVYVVPTGELETMLSDGIVTYDKTLKILKEFEKDGN